MRPVSYDYYARSYGGSSVEEADWQRAAQTASAHLERLRTLCTLTPYGDGRECESMAVCAIAEALQSWDEASSGVTSEHIGSVSVSYAGAEQAMPGGLPGGVLDAVRPWFHVCQVIA